MTRSVVADARLPAAVVLVLAIMSVSVINAQSMNNMGPCPNITWLLSANTNYYGGISISATNLTDCQNKCAVNMTCTGVDWNQGSSPGQQCWMIGPWSYYRNFGQSYGIQHYDIVRHINCPECLKTWTLVANTNVNGGVLRADAMEVRNCQVFCARTTDCTGIDWNPNNPMGSQCWLIMGNSQQRNVGSSPGVLHYDLMRVGGCPTEGDLIISKTGGYLTVNRMTTKIELTNNYLEARYFTYTPSCLALMNAVSSSFYQSLESGLPANAACLSISMPDWPGWYARDRGCGVYFEPPNGQRFPDRYYQDTSFIGTALDSTFATLQSTVYDNVYFMANANESMAQFDSIMPMMPMMSGGSMGQAPMDAAVFALVKKSLNSGPIIHVCPNIWTRIDNVGVAGGGVFMPTSQHNDSSMMFDGDDICRALCISFPYCVGVTYNMTGCYFVTSSGANQQLVPSEMSTYWELTRSTFPGSCSTGCVYDWSRTNLWYDHYFVQNVTEAMSPFECRWVCVMAGSMCVGVNGTVDSNGRPLCQLIMGYAMYWPSYPMMTSYSFMKKTAAYDGCGSCSSSVGMHANKTDMSAVMAPSLTEMSLAECLTSCYNSPSCIGVEIRPNGTTPKSPLAAASYQSGLCYHSLRINGNMQLQNSSNGVTHIDIFPSPCGNGCVNKWQHFYNTRAAVLTLLPDVMSEAACRRSCAMNSTCTGVNWNYYGGQCYLANGYALAQIGTASGWNYFMLMRGQKCE